MYLTSALQARIEAQWTNRKIKLDWLELEQILRDILESDDVDERNKSILIADAIGAWTKRGVPVIKWPAPEVE